jgi:formamidopyrimidine-DNA glycosylase
MLVVTLIDSGGQIVIQELCPSHKVKPPVTAATITTTAQKPRQQIITEVFNDAIQQEMVTIREHLGSYSGYLVDDRDNSDSEGL